MSQSTLHWHPAKNKTKDEVVVFIHHFGGNYKTTKRHVKMMNCFGYDCVSFDFSCNFEKFSFKTFFSFNFNGFFHRGGVIRIWSNELIDALNQIDRPVILYSFSSLSLAVPKAVITKPNQIKAWLCDGGPFLDIHKSFERFYTYVHKVQNPVILFLLKINSTLAWRSWKLNRVMHKQLSQFPKNFPILSVRGTNDKLVCPEDIEKVFNGFDNHLDLSRFTIKNGGHLDGLTRFPVEYKQSITRFLTQL